MAANALDWFSDILKQYQVDKGQSQGQPLLPPRQSYYQEDVPMNSSPLVGVNEATSQSGNIDKLQAQQGWQAGPAGGAATGDSLGMSNPQSWNIPAAPSGFQGQGNIGGGGQPAAKPSGGGATPEGFSALGSLLQSGSRENGPHALTRLGVGYEQGGLLGALGYLLTDMRKNQPTQTKQ